MAPATYTPTKNQFRQPITKVTLKEIRAEVNGWITRGFKLWKATYASVNGSLREVFYLDITKNGRLTERVCFGHDGHEAENTYYNEIATY